MASASEFQDRIAQILESHFTSGRLSFSINWDTPEEAKIQLNRIRLKQKELRLVKKDINATMKAIRSEYTARKAQVGTGLGSGIMAGLLGKKAVGRSNAIEKENLRRKQAAELSPYSALARAIDDALIQLDKVKIQIEMSISEYNKK